jgi:hypothetical protein
VLITVGMTISPKFCKSGQSNHLLSLVLPVTARSTKVFRGDWVNT